MKESEEAKVKNIEWLKDEVKLLFDKAYELGKMDYHEAEESIHKINSLINQLDEPEVLSQKWIDKNKTSIDRKLDGTPIYKVREELLQNLLVPKQELPVIPKFVAEWISVHHEQFDLYPALKRLELENNALSWKDVYEWYRRNTHTFVNAYLTGKYEVEEEQKYQVIIRDGKYMRLYLCKHYSNVTIGTNDNYIEKCPEFTYLTEQEIKNYDERFWAFAVKIEEL